MQMVYTEDDLRIDASGRNGVGDDAHEFAEKAVNKLVSETCGFTKAYKNPVSAVLSVLMWGEKRYLIAISLTATNKSTGKTEEVADLQVWSKSFLGWSIQKKGTTAYGAYEGYIENQFVSDDGERIVYSRDNAIRNIYFR